MRPKEIEVDRERKPGKRKAFQSFRNYFREYCQCTSIHGFRYFGEKRTIFERFWWFLVFTTCLALCSYCIYLVYDKWHSSPVIVSFATTETPIYNIPFPAVTICPETKTDRQLFNYTDVFLKKLAKQAVTSEEDMNFNYMSIICDSGSHVPLSENLTFPDSYFDTITDISSKISIWGGKLIDMRLDSADFTPTITEEGLCKTFNMVDRDEFFTDIVKYENDFYDSQYSSKNWSVETGYTHDAGIESYPRRALLAGAENALVIKLGVRESDLDYLCKNDSLQGYRVLLHSPAQFPRPYQKYFRVPLDSSVVVGVDPVVINTSASIGTYSPEKRQCFFDHERQLMYFRIYSKTNCELECLTNFTLRNCGCVDFYMPRAADTPICGTGKKACLWDSEREMHGVQLHDELMGHTNQSFYDEPENISDQTAKCACKPLCTSLTYTAEISQVEWPWRQFYAAGGKLESPFEKQFNGSKKVHLSILRIYFKNNHFIPLLRNVLYGPTDFLANFGGLLGLFTGFSILSLMEIIYFLSLRIICNLNLYGYWAGVRD